MTTALRFCCATSIVHLSLSHSWDAASGKWPRAHHQLPLKFFGISCLEITIYISEQQQSIHFNLPMLPPKWYWCTCTFPAMHLAALLTIAPVRSWLFLGWILQLTLDPYSVTGVLSLVVTCTGVIKHSRVSADIHVLAQYADGLVWSSTWEKWKTRRKNRVRWSQLLCRHPIDILLLKGLGGVYMVLDFNKLNFHFYSQPCAGY